MATSYPRRNTSGGIWKVTDAATNLLTKGTWPGDPTPGGRMVVGGGDTPSSTGVANIDYITISTTGDATDFGDLTAHGSNTEVGALGSFTRGVFEAGGSSNVIDYITFASTGNAADFGDLTVTHTAHDGCGNATRGMMGAGATPSTSNVIEYITIAVTGNATDFGDLTVARNNSSCFSSPTRAIWCCGTDKVDTIDFVEIATTGDAVDFGDYVIATANLAGLASSTRGMSGGGIATTPGYHPQDTIAYVTMAAKSDTTDFGNLTTGTAELAAGSSLTRGVFAGGKSPGLTNVIEYITIASTGNATDFGDCTNSQGFWSGTSNGHGGLEAFDPRLISLGSGRAIVGGGSSPGGSDDLNIMEYFNINNLGNTVDFGDLVKSVQTMAASGSHTRGIFAGGKDPGNLNDIQSVEIHSLGNAADFGDLTASRGNMQRGTSNQTRGLAAAGSTPSYSDIVDYITIATAGDAADFGDLTAAAIKVGGSGGSTRALFAGGFTASDVYSDVIDYFTIASTGDATDFGNLVTGRHEASGGSSATRAIVAQGGETPGGSLSDEIDYVTIASTGNATDFGNLTDAKYQTAGNSTNIRCVAAGGLDPSSVNVIEYITIASTGNGADFGDLGRVNRAAGIVSDAHGGLS